MRKRGRGQVSVEYLIVLGLAFMLLLPGAYLFFSFSKGTDDQLATARIGRAGMEILNTVDAMYAVGKNSWSTVNVNFPGNVNSIYIVGGTELVIGYDTQNGMSEAVFFGNVNMTTPYMGGNVSPQFHPGVTKIKVSYNTTSIVVEEIVL